MIAFWKLRWTPSWIVQRKALLAQSWFTLHNHVTDVFKIKFFDNISIKFVIQLSFLISVPDIVVCSVCFRSLSFLLLVYERFNLGADTWLQILHRKWICCFFTLLWHLYSFLSTYSPLSLNEFKEKKRKASLKYILSCSIYRTHCHTNDVPTYLPGLQPLQYNVLRNFQSHGSKSKWRKVSEINFSY